jgi:cellulose synthase/poly-beta-1,6-N-acetylglucosamine synthase-like glycosyltransferase
MNMNDKLSIVMPTWNEDGNIQLLIERIDKTLKSKQIIYEIIVVDDNSTDKTQKIVNSLQTMYPVSLHIKKGEKSKAQSLLDGFTYAKYDLICMIDADLQYPPEAIPEMIKKIGENKDIIIANRLERHVSFRRKAISSIFRRFFGKFLHGFTCDVQSGLKIFRKEIVERIQLHPSQWTFDLEFLVKARNAGYKIDTIDIVFQKRHSGKSKKSLVTASFEMGIAAFKLAFVTPEMVPFHPEVQKIKGKGFHYKGKEFIPHTDLHQNDSAFHRVSLSQVAFISFLMALFIFGIVNNWHATITLLIALLTCLYFSDLIFNFFLIFRSFSKSPEIQITDEEIANNNDWPSYTIFCPLYKEGDVLPQFVTAMSRLDYPKEKLQILLLLEEDDKETVERAKAYNLPSYFQTIVIPHSMPKTKPKALNYGLMYATGEYTVVYDAEDVPDTLQLKKAILAFKKSDKRTVCIQAKLNFYNPHQNILTRIFTAEYSLWFDLVLTGLQSIHAPIPLGGTSNHFRTQDLHDLKGWDAFNVTEDCDLGMRLVKQGFRTAVVNSMTLEEANSDLKNWFQQRSRWIKGYIQTYLVHMRDPRHFMKDWKEPHAVTFQLVVGGKILSMFINPVMWIITISYFAFRPILGTFIESFFPAPVLYMAVFSLVFGNFLYMYYYMIGCAKREYDDIIKYVFLVPFYWLMMSMAASKAVYKIFVDPHYWAKTNHGLHLNNKKTMKQVNEAVGNKLVDKELTAYPIELPEAIVKKE